MSSEFGKRANRKQNVRSGDFKQISPLFIFVGDIGDIGDIVGDIVGVDGSALLPQGKVIGC